MWQNSAPMKTQAVSSQDHDDAAHGHRSMVRFGPATIIEYIPTRKELWEEQGDRLWWSRRDFQDFLHVTKFTGREIRRKGLADGISIAYQEVRQLVAQINEDILQQMIVDHPTDDKLVYWCKFGHSRRGLEMYGSDVLRHARCHAAEKTTTKVLSLSSKVDCNVIRETSEASSRASRLFARMMGEADARAVQHSQCRQPKIASNARNMKLDASSSREKIHLVTKAPSYPKGVIAN